MSENKKRKFVDTVMMIIIVALAVSTVLNVFAFYQVQRIIQEQEKEFPWIVVKGYVTEKFSGEPVALAHVLAFVGGEGEIAHIFSISDAYTDNDGFFYLETPVWRDYFEVICSVKNGFSEEYIVTLTEEDAVVGDWSSRLVFNQNFTIILEGEKK